MKRGKDGQEKQRKQRGFVRLCAEQRKKINQVEWRDQGRKAMTHSGSVIQQEDQNRAIISWQVMQRAAIILLPILAVTVLLSVERNTTGARFLSLLVHTKLTVV